MWAWLLGGLAAAVVVTEITARGVVRRRTDALLHQVLTLEEPARITLPRGPLLPRLARGTVRELDIRCGAAALPGLRMIDLQLHLHDVRIRPDLSVVGGRGQLEVLIEEDEIGHWVGLPGRVRLGEDAATVRWMGLPLRFKPVLEAGRIRLTPLPLSMTLPPLPPGTTVVGVAARTLGMSVIADVDVGLMFAPPASGLAAPSDPSG